MIPRSLSSRVVKGGTPPRPARRAGESGARRRTPGVFLLIAAALTLAAVPARGQLVDEEAVGRLTIGLGIGVLLPSMGDVNDNIDVVNPFLDREQIRGIDHINQGLLTSLDVRYRLGRTPPEDPDETVSLTDRITVGFSWGAVSASTGLDDVTFARARLWSRATTYYPYVMYHLPFLESVAPRTQLLVGGGPLFLRNARVEWEFEDTRSPPNSFIEEGDISELAGVSKASGSALGFVLQGGGTFMLNRRFSVAADLGYRHGKISNLTLDEASGFEARFPAPPPGQPDIVRRLGDWSVIDFFLRNPDAEWQGRKRTDPYPEGVCDDCRAPYYTGGQLDFDYSGPFLNFSLRVHF